MINRIISDSIQDCVEVYNKYTVKPALRGHLWDKKNWPYKTGDLLKEVQFIKKIMTGQEKGDFLIQVTA